MRFAASAAPLSDHTPNSGGTAAFLPAAALIGAVLLQLLAEVHVLEPYRMAFVVGGLMILLLSLGCARNSRRAPAADTRQLLTQSATPFVMALALWAIAAYGRSEFRTVAFADLLRILSGVFAFLIATLLLRGSPANRLFVAAGTILLSVAFCLIGISEAGQSGSMIEGLHSGFFGTHEEMGTLLLLPLPVAAALALVPGDSERRRLFGFASVILLLIGLLLSQCRSAWLGAGAAAVTLAVSLRLSAPLQRRQSPRRQTGFLVPAAVGLTLAGGIGLAIVTTGAGPTVAQRAGSLSALLSPAGKEVIIADRLRKWQGAVVMAAQRPVTGWGLGAFQVQQARWTHQGTDTPEVLLSGSGHENIAHNYYVQWAADTGSVGLLLYVAALSVTGSVAVRTLKEQSRADVPLTPQSRALLCGCFAALVGGAVDAFGSPSYNFAGLSTLYWTLAGLCVDTARIARLPDRTTVAFGLAAGALGAGIVLAVGFVTIRSGAREARGVLRLIASPAVPTPSGTELTWTASFVDGAGRSRPTAPGIRWRVEASPFVLTTAPTQLLRLPSVAPEENSAERVSQAVLRMRVPAGEPVRVRATYRDRTGQPYTAAGTGNGGTLSSERRPAAVRKHSLPPKTVRGYKIEKD